VTRREVFLTGVMLAFITAGLVTGCRPAGHHLSYKQADRQARQSQARDIKNLLRPYCHGKPLGSFPLTARQLAGLCRQWHLYGDRVELLAASGRADVLPPPAGQLVYICTAQPCWNHQELLVLDPPRIPGDVNSQAPILSVDESGHAAVWGAEFWVAKDVFHLPGVRLTPDGRVITRQVIVGGQVLTGRDVAFVHCLEKRRLAWCRTAVGP